MAAVYGTAEIRIVSHDGAASEHSGLTVVDAEHRDGLALTTALRRRIIDAAVARSARERFRMCVVFADDDSVFVEPDGSVSRANSAPSGGIRLDKVRR